MKADTELKRYTIVGGCWDEFLDIWQKLVPIRRRFGFDVLFALVDRDRSLFTWAVSHPGDIVAANQNYQEDPERIALDAISKYVSGAETARVSRITIP